MNAMEFFQKSSGVWRSQRTTHHLAFKRAEMGGSEIRVQALDKDTPAIIELCKLHEIDPDLAIGGANVTWEGTMAWDRNDGEVHEGKTAFALVPDDETGRKGRLLRELGYAEIVPVVGRYEMDEEDGLVLLTDYESMSSRERFWFADDNTRVRTSTVKRFGGFSSATFCSETRVEAAIEGDKAPTQIQSEEKVASLFGW
ncbi:phycobiliprotein lyase [filamentous cyanobacterium LEGE 11480]|uniref:Chromophore lyase CpcS/CpeS n=2 Tax=Romeriopsis TaxID=2992131 RepID=A0A928Z378_9CYAN|nr:phycobiliprotein lyase [Romeriopsis navalis LEGE 11480]